MRAFAGMPFYEFAQRRVANLIAEIKNKSKEYLLQVNESEFKEYLFSKYSLEPLAIDQESEFYGEPIKKTELITTQNFGRESYQAEVYYFTISYNYSGSSELWGLQPQGRFLTSHEISVDSVYRKVSFQVRIINHDSEEFFRQKSQHFSNAFANVANIAADAENFNRNLTSVIRRELHAQIERFRSENNFFEKLNLKSRIDNPRTISVPVMKKPIPKVPELPSGREFASFPELANKVYEEILSEIYEDGKNMEKRPSLYQGKDEEGLRDLFLSYLERRFTQITATGETFNKGGKTDILLKHAQDGSNVFIAECKFWNGPSQFFAAIDQLFGRYLTWRDTKTALIIFVRNREIMPVIETIQIEITQHALFKKFAGKRGDSSFSYHFALPQDSKQTVFLEVMAFHFDR